MKTKPYLLAGLVVSIAINLALIGFVAGRATDTVFRPPPPADPSMMIRGLLGELSEARRETLGIHFRAYFATLKPGFREMRQNQRNFRAALMAEPLDPEALRTAMDELSTHLCEAQPSSQDAFLALIGALTLQERALLVERLRRGGSHFKPGERRGPGGSWQPAGERQPPPAHNRPS